MEESDLAMAAVKLNVHLANTLIHLRKISSRAVLQLLEFGGPCRDRTYGPLIKSPVETQPSNTQPDLVARQHEDES